MPSLVQPWIKTLQALPIEPVADDDVGPSRVWIQWLLPSNAPPGELLERLEAIAMVVRLAWSDTDAWRDAIERVRAGSIDGFARDWETLVLEPRQLPRVLGFDVVCTEVKDAKMFCDFLSSPTDEQGALEHRTVATLIKPDYDRIPIPVRLRLMPKQFWRGDQSTVLPRLAALGALQARLESSSGPDQSLCRLARLQIRIMRFYNDLPESSLVNEPSLRLLDEIWSHGIQAIDLPRIQFSLEPTNLRWYVRTIQSLCGIGTEGCLRRITVGSIRQATVTPSLLSALAESPTVRKVSLNFDDLDPGRNSAAATRDAVQWMAYALLSPHVKNAIDCISMRSRSLTMDHVDMMYEVLAADDPLLVLYPGFAETIRAQSHVRISASCLLLDDPSLATAETMTRDCGAFTNLRVLDRASGWWAVLLPGWGPAWIEDSQATVSSEAAVQTSTVRSPTTLMLTQLGPQTHDAALALLELVGSRVKVLRFMDGYHPVNMFCTAMFHSCPHLEELELRGSDLDGTAVWVEDFASGRCCHLRRLDIVVKRMTVTAVQEFVQMLEVLSDPSHPMTQQLEELAIDSYVATDGEEVDSSVLDRVLDMLHMNTRLTRLKLRLPLAPQAKMEIQRLSRAFAIHDKSVLPTPVAPLGSREKAAFLSAIWNNTTESARASFDRRILSTIFEFAPDRRRRFVDVNVPPEATGI